MSEAKRKTALDNLAKATEANRLRRAQAPKTFFHCKTCGIAVICKPSHLKLKSYCSKDCMAEDHKVRMRGSENPHFLSAGQRKCEGCGRLYLNYNKSRKYCSRDCYGRSGKAVENARMNGRKNKRGGRTDHNQAEIVKALREMGASVLCADQQGGGFPDLIVGWRGQNYLIEIKNPNSQYGRSGFNPNQKAWNSLWKGSAPMIVRTIDEAIAILTQKP